MTKKPLALRVDEELLARVDRERGLVSRTAWIVEALEKTLDGHTVARPVEPEDAGREAGAEKAPRSPSVVSAPSRASEPPVEVPLPPKVPVRTPYQKPFVPRPKGS